MSNLTPENITVRPVDVFYGLRNKDSITCVADVADSLNNTYFEFESIDSSGTVSQYYAWYNTGAGSDPGGTGTGIEVSISTGATASAVASATKSAIDSSAARVSVSASAGVLKIESGFMGVVTAANDAGSTGFTFASEAVGEKFIFGGTDSVTFSPSEDYEDVTAEQFGTDILDQILTGTNVEVTIPAKESTAELFEKTLGAVSGDILTVGSDNVTGSGQSKKFKNMKQFSKELALVPSNESDLINAVCFWKCKPTQTNINYDSSTQVIEYTFQAYQDLVRPDEISLYARGKFDKGMLK